MDKIKFGKGNICKKGNKREKYEKWFVKENENDKVGKERKKSGTERKKKQQRREKETFGCPAMHYAIASRALQFQI